MCFLWLKLCSVTSIVHFRSSYTRLSNTSPLWFVVFKSLKFVKIICFLFKFQTIKYNNLPDVDANFPFKKILVKQIVVSIRKNTTSCDLSPICCRPSVHMFFRDKYRQKKTNKFNCVILVYINERLIYKKFLLNSMWIQSQTFIVINKQQIVYRIYCVIYKWIQSRLF